MRSINTTQNPQPSTLLRQPLKREPHARQRANRIKNRHSRPRPSRLDPPHRLKKPLHNLPVPTGKLIPPHLLRADIRRRLEDGGDRLLARAVDGVEIDDHVTGCVDEVAEHGVDAQGGVLEEDAGVEGAVEEVGDGGAGGEEGVGGLVAQEFVGGGFGEGLEVVEGGADGVGVGAEGACLQGGGVGCWLRGWLGKEEGMA